MRGAAWMALCAALGCAATGVAPAWSGTRAWWAHVPLDSLRPPLPPVATGAAPREDGRDTLPGAVTVHVLPVGPQPLAPLRLGAHVAWRGVAADPRAPGPVTLAPRRVAAGRVVWTRGPAPGPAVRACGLPEWEEVRGDSAVFDSVVFWRHMAEGVQPMVAAWRQVARLALADGDTLAADSFLASPPLARSVWAWPVVRQRAELALARGATARADSLLESADREGWPDAERAAWLALRVRLRTDLGDTARAVGFARQALRVYPSLPATGRSLALLETLLGARGDSLTAEEQRAAAEVDAFAGRRAAAIRRLRAVVAGPASGGAGGAAALRLCELLRATRRFSEAGATIDALLRAPERAAPRARLWMEKARAELGAGRPDSALAIYARLAGEDSLRPRLGWEAGRTAEDAGRWEESLRWYGRVPRAAARGREARFRSGLLHFALGRTDSALACWAPDSSDDARFWVGVARRALGDTAGGDSLLRAVAARPGYSFYRAAARDSLGVRGWTGGIAADRCGEDSLCEPLREVRDLAGLGLVDEAALLLARWVAGDVRVRPRSWEPRAAEWLYAARQAYSIGRLGMASSLAGMARESQSGRAAGQPWDAVPWEFPPAFESLFVAPRDSAVADVEPALLFAVAYQESRFDARARSLSDALGLMQLKLATARDVARWAREPEPTEATLFDPETNVRYGARYLARLARRFDGSVAAALAAYNAGPGSLSPRWRELRGRGGEALLCELVSNPLAQDYARRILGYRQAYRELRPTAEAP